MDGHSRASARLARVKGRNPMRVRGMIITSLVLVLLAGSWGGSLRPARAQSEQDMMAAHMAAATPGEHHQFLQQFVGSWTLKIKMWQDPSAPPMVSEGEAEVTSSFITYSVFLEFAFGRHPTQVLLPPRRAWRTVRRKQPTTAARGCQELAV